MWKLGCRVMGWVMVLFLVGGCQWTSSVGSRLGSWWRSKEDEEYRLLLKSIDEYARKNGLTRQQAIRQLREEADRYALEQRQQGALYSQQGGNLSPPAYGAQQRPPFLQASPSPVPGRSSPDVGVNQASWTQPPPAGETSNPLGLKPSSSVFR